MTDNKIKILEKKANDFLSDLYQNQQPIFYNLEFFSNICRIFIKLIEKTKLERLNFSFYDLTSISMSDSINLVKKFYKENNIKFDIDKLIQDGSLDFNYFEKGLNKKNKAMNIYEEGNHNAIILDFLGTIIDPFVLTHELSHYKNQSDRYRTIDGDLITEGISMGESLIFLDYLKSNGYDEFEINSIKYNEYYVRYEQALEALFQIDILRIYDASTSLSENSFTWFLNNIDKLNYSYVDFKERINNINIEKIEFNFIFHIWYVLGIFIASYIYNKYKEDKDFYLKIEELNSKIKKRECVDLISMLKVIDLDITTNGVEIMAHYLNKELSSIDFLEFKKK